MNRARVYTDGACKGNFGECPGGWAALIVTGDGEAVISGGDHATTNNAMELTAAIKALEALPAGLPATVLTDSQYVVKGLTEWLPGWKRRGWRNNDRKPVANRALWERLEALAGEREVAFEWVKGHAGHAENERVDGLAGAEAEKAAAESGWTEAARYGFRAGPEGAGRGAEGGAR